MHRLKGRVKKLKISCFACWHNLYEIRQRLETLQQQQTATDIANWKHRLKNSSRECFRWLTGHSVLPTPQVFSRNAPALGTSDSTAGALRILAEHWRAQWDRPVAPDQHLASILPFVPNFPEQQWEPMSGPHLLKTAKKFCGKCASVGSWTGDEIASLPINILEDVALLFNLFEQAGLIPAFWAKARQVHLPKEGPREDGCVDAAKLRPITVLSAWYRLWGSARLQTQNVQQWLGLWWPEEPCSRYKQLPWWLLYRYSWLQSCLWLTCAGYGCCPVTTRRAPKWCVPNAFEPVGKSSQIPRIRKGCTSSGARCLYISSSRRYLECGCYGDGVDSCHPGHQAKVSS